MINNFKQGLIVIISKYGSEFHINKYDLLIIINRVYHLDLDIKPTQTDKVCHRNLSSDNAIVVESDIEQQIIDMEKFSPHLD